MKLDFQQILLTVTLFLFAFSATIASPFTNNGNGTVTDQQTGLVWQQCSAGLSGGTCGTGTATAYTWASALTYCEGLSFASRTDWRLPSVNELQSIVDETTGIPAIATASFPGTADLYWSSSTYVPVATYAWTVYFFYGYVGANVKTSNNYVRCVSTGP